MDWSASSALLTPLVGDGRPIESFGALALRVQLTPALAERDGQLGEVLGKSGLDEVAHVSREPRRGTSRRDRHRDVTALGLSHEVGRTACGVIDHVDQTVATLDVLHNSIVHPVIPGRGDHEQGARRVAATVRSPMHFDLGGQFSQDPRRDDGHSRAGSHELASPQRTHPAGADHEDPSALNA